jgi:hypothetical protein
MNFPFGKGLKAGSTSIILNSGSINIRGGSGNDQFVLNGSGASIGIGAPTANAMATFSAGSNLTPPLQFYYKQLTTATGSGTGSVITLTFDTQSSVPFPTGSSVVVSGVTPSGYNGTYSVISGNTSRITAAGAATGAITVPGKITTGILVTTPVSGAVEYDGGDFYLTDSSGTRYFIPKILKGSATLDFPSTAAQTSSELTITVTGASDGDDVIVSPPSSSSNDNSMFSARVSTANTVSVKFNNYSSSAIDPASGTFKVKVFK